MKSQAEIIGEYVIWLERNANMIQQMFANGIIENAPLWYEAMQSQSDKANNPKGEQCERD